MRGDGQTSRAATRRNRGSPPRAWGRQRTTPPDDAPRRFTPTCVGTALNSALFSNTPAVHPHVRGDGDAVERVHDQGRGSPPRAWGRRGRDELPGPVRRFTPTCVGTAAQHDAFMAGAAVHPYVRGDGAQPNRRGAHLVRFTPTCVGTARPRCSRTTSRTVHPHVRGDGCWISVGKSRATGSPPRAWGRRPFSPLPTS